MLKLFPIILQKNYIHQSQVYLDENNIFNSFVIIFKA